MESVDPIGMLVVLPSRLSSFLFSRLCLKPEPQEQKHFFRYNKDTLTQWGNEKVIINLITSNLLDAIEHKNLCIQVIKARFGKRTHIVFCVFAFFTNLIVMMSLTIAGTAVLNSLVADLSPELAAMLLATVIGGYTLIGGLGATFYVSYFNTALIFILILMLVVEVSFTE